MQIEAFKVFCDLVDTGSFTGSALINGVTQSAVSQQINALERTFQTQLLDRQQGKGRVRLTSKGQMLYDCGKKILAVYSSLITQMSHAPIENRAEKEVVSAKFGNAPCVSRADDVDADDLQI